MNYKDFNYETVEERNVAKMRAKRTNNSCSHSYIVYRLIETLSRSFYWPYGVIHIRCEKCDYKRKFQATTATLNSYKIGDKWKGREKIKYDFDWYSNITKSTEDN